jgi:hypothetical protein
MAHYKSYLDPGKYLGPADFPAEREITISRLAREKLPARDGEPEQFAPMLYVVAKDGSEYPKPYKVPKSVMYGLSLAFGTEADAWKGQKIGMFKTTCASFGDVEECLRLQFTPEIHAKIFKWMKKRKSNRSAYMIISKEDSNAQ